MHARGSPSIWLSFTYFLWSSSYVRVSPSKRCSGNFQNVFEIIIIKFRRYYTSTKSGSVSTWCNGVACWHRSLLTSTVCQRTSALLVSACCLQSGLARACWVCNGREQDKIPFLSRRKKVLKDEQRSCRSARASLFKTGTGKACRRARGSWSTSCPEDSGQASYNWQEGAKGWEREGMRQLYMYFGQLILLNI